jgi:hypothetical protein
LQGRSTRGLEFVESCSIPTAITIAPAIPKIPEMGDEAPRNYLLHSAKCGVYKTGNPGDQTGNPGQSAQFDLGRVLRLERIVVS